MQIGKLKLIGSKMKFYCFICSARWKSISVKCSLRFYFRKIGNYKSETSKIFWLRYFKKSILPMLEKLFEMCAKSLQSCSTLCDPTDCSPPGSPVHVILQTRTLEWVAIPSSGGSSRPRDQTHVSCMAGRFFTLWATREAPPRRPQQVTGGSENPTLPFPQPLLSDCLW